MEVWQAMFSAAAQAEGYSSPKIEYRFHSTRMWRFDLAWVDLKVAFEKEGLPPRDGKSRHTNPEGYANDCEKYNIAQISGWVVIRGTSHMIKSGVALSHLLEALKCRGKLTGQKG